MHIVFQQYCSNEMCDASLNNTIHTKYILLRIWLEIAEIRLISVEFA